MVAGVSSTTGKIFGHRASARRGVVARPILINVILKFSETNLSFGAQRANYDYIF